MRFATLIGPDLKDLLREEPEHLAEVLEEVHPEDIAEIVQDFAPDEAAQILKHLPADVGAPIFERLERTRQLEVLPALDVPIAARLIEQMSADDRADVVQELDPEFRAKVLALFEPDEARDVRELAKYPENTAGGLMTTDYISVSEGATVRQAIEAVRTWGHEAETVYYVYVVHDADAQPHHRHSSRPSSLTAQHPLGTSAAGAPSSAGRPGVPPGPRGVTTTGSYAAQRPGAPTPASSTAGAATTSAPAAGSATTSATGQQAVTGGGAGGGAATTTQPEGPSPGALKLLGVASLRTLLLSELDQKITEVMTENVIAVPPELDQEEVARTLAKYDLSAVPVVDKFQRLLGVITFDDVIDVLVAEQTEDVQRLAGVEPVEEAYFETGFWRFISARARWLIALFIGELFTSTALARYEDAFKTVGTLVLFIPLVISSGGNSGSQSATLVIRAMAIGQIKDGDAMKVMTRELFQGVVLGLILGAIGFVRAMLWRPRVAHQTQIAVIVAATLVAVVTIGTTVGSALPMLLKRMRFDPAVSSTPFIASLVDVFGIVAYFTIARAVLGAILSVAQ